MTRKEEISKAARCLKKVQKIGIFEVQSANQCLKDAALQNAFIKGAEWADANPHWISIDDELPPCNVFVLTCDRQENTNLLMLAGDGRWYDKAVGLHRNITHWMPLPKAPSSSEKPNNCEKGGEE